MVKGNYELNLSNNSGSETSTRHQFWHKATSRSCGHLSYAVSSINRTPPQGTLLCGTQPRHHWPSLILHGSMHKIQIGTHHPRKLSCKQDVCKQRTMAASFRNIPQQNVASSHLNLHTILPPRDLCPLGLRPKRKNIFHHV